MHWNIVKSLKGASHGQVYEIYLLFISSAESRHFLLFQIINFICFSPCSRAHRIAVRPQATQPKPQRSQCSANIFSHCLLSLAETEDNLLMKSFHFQADDDDDGDVKRELKGKSTSDFSAYLSQHRVFFRLFTVQQLCLIAHFRISIESRYTYCWMKGLNGSQFTVCRRLSAVYSMSRWHDWRINQDNFLIQRIKATKQRRKRNMKALLCSCSWRRALL